VSPKVEEVQTNVGVSLVLCLLAPAKRPAATTSDFGSIAKMFLNRLSFFVSLAKPELYTINIFLNVTGD